MPGFENIFCIGRRGRSKGLTPMVTQAAISSSRELDWRHEESIGFHWSAGRGVRRRVGCRLGAGGGTGGAVWSPDSQRILFTSRVYPECSQGSSWMEEDNCDKRKDAEAAANPVKAQTWDHLLYRHWNDYVGPKRSHVLVVSATDGSAVRDLTPREDIGEAEAPTFSLGGPVGYAWAPDSKEVAFVTNVDVVPAASTTNGVFRLRLDTSGAA